jgi:AmiR/NasT family two-component response regulator
VSDELRETMRVRDLVNTAKGVLMAREEVDDRTAFLLLTTMAREQGTTIGAVARSVTSTTTRRRR